MAVIELDASIVDHRIDVRSLRLPASARHARIIVLVEESDAAGAAAEPGPAEVLALARAAQLSFPRVDADRLAGELAGLRDEWARQP